MLKYKLRSIDDREAIWDVRYWFKFNPTVKDFLSDIQEKALKDTNLDYVVWIYGNGFTLGYASFHGSQAKYYCDKNTEVWDAVVTKCECHLKGIQYLYQIWTRDNYESAVVPVRPMVPKRFLEAYAVSTE